MCRIQGRECRACHCYALGTGVHNLPDQFAGIDVPPNLAFCPQHEVVHRSRDLILDGGLLVDIVRVYVVGHVDVVACHRGGLHCHIVCQRTFRPVTEGVAHDLQKFRTGERPAFQQDTHIHRTG